MAQQPLIVQRPSVSLIGGQELQKASGAGVPVPDLGNAFSELSAALLQRDRANRAIDDEVAAKADVEAWRGTVTGKDPLGAVRRIPPINGSPAYRAAALNALEQNTISTIARDHETAAGLIQVKIGVPTDEKLSLIRSRGEGVLATVAPEYRGIVRDYLQRDYSQRENLMRSQDAAETEQAMYAGIVQRRDDNYDRAVTAAASGGDYQQYTQEMYKAIDELVDLNKMIPDDAAKQKVLLGNMVVAAGIQGTIANGAFEGKVGAADVLEFGEALDSGADAELMLTDANEASLYTPGMQTDPHIRPPVTKKITTADDYRKLIGDPTKIKQIASDFKELGNYLLAGTKAMEKRLQIKADIEGPLARDPAQILAPGLRPTFDDIMSEIIRAGALDKLGTPEQDAAALDQLVTLTRRTRYLAPVVAEAMVAKVQGTLEESLAVLQLWQRISTAVAGDVETGNIIQKNMKPEERMALDNARDAANDVINASGGDMKRATEQWRLLMTELKKPENTIQHWKEEYKLKSSSYVGSQTSFDTALRDAFIDHYGRETLDPQFQHEAEAAYLNTMSLSPGITPQKALDAVLARMYDRYTASDIFFGGLSRGEEWTNPDWYKDDRVTRDVHGQAVPGTAVNEHQWASDMVTDQIHQFWDVGQLELSDPDVVTALNSVLAAGNPTPLGSGLVLQALPSNLGDTQYYVMLKMQDDTWHKLQVKARDGTTVPLVVDPGIVRSNITARELNRKALQELSLAGTTSQVQQISLQFDKTRLDASRGFSKFDVMAGQGPVYDKWFLAQDEAWRTKFKQDQDKRLEVFRSEKARRDALVPQVYFTVDPKILNAPRAIGEDVSLGAVSAVLAALPGDENLGQFMVNLISAESDFGRAKGTFRAEGDRGLGQVNDTGTGALVEVQRRARVPGDPMYAANQIAKARLGIDVTTLAPSDLESPLANVLVSRMYLMRTQLPVPADATAQAEYWRDWYNPGADNDMINDFVRVADRVMFAPAYAADSAAPGGPGLITDMQGNAFPANFTATNPMTQTSALRLSSAFGRPLRITPHGGTQADARKQTSQHHHKTAIDIYVADMSDADKTRLIALALKMGYRGVGGYGAGDGVGTIHLDLRRSAGRGPNGVALWWRKRPGVDSDWRTGQKWFTDGINQGLGLRGQYSA